MNTNNSTIGVWGYVVRGKKLILNKLFPYKDLDPASRYAYQYLFEHYLGKPKPSVKLLIAEYPHLSTEFVRDHSMVFNICHEELDRSCIRIHFFSKNLLPKGGDLVPVLREEVHNQNENKVQEYYLGFAVLRNFGSRRLVKVVLKRFPTSDTSRVSRGTYVKDPIDPKIKVYRVISAKVRYPVNLLGFDLYVDSLAYREQDKATGACATCALWSTFQKTSDLFDHRIPSPSQITAMATAHESARPDNIPSSVQKGLHINQMASVIAQVPELQPLKFDFGEYEDESKRKRVCLELLYAYLRDMGIPSILACKVYEVVGKKENFTFTGKWHAITVTGYNLQPVISDPPNPPVESGPSLYAARENHKFPDWRVLAHRISSLIIHDDNIGPYVQYNFLKKHSDRKKLPEKENLKIETPALENRRLEIKCILIPIYYSIRTTYQSVVNVIDEFQKELCRIRAGERSILFKYLDNFFLEWDIYLTMSKDYKNDVLKEEGIKNDGIEKINFPTYVWRARAYRHGIQKDSNIEIPFMKKEEYPLLLEIIFDSTSIDRCRLLYGRLFIKDEDMKERLRYLKKDKNIMNVEIAGQLLMSCIKQSQKKKGYPTLPTFLIGKKWKPI